MAINATNKGSDFEVVPAGLYMARCYSMVHIGTLKEVIKGEEKMMNKVRISWELPTEMKVFKPGEPERPLSISKEFNLSMNEKSHLRKFLEGWRGKGFTKEEAETFDVTKLLGKACMLSVLHKTSGKGNIYADVSMCTVLMKGATCPPQINPTFEFNYEQFNDKKFSAIPQFLKDKMVNSVEYRKLFAETVKEEVKASAPSGEGEDLPFALTPDDDLPF